MNGKCCGTELHRALQTALTPLQKALARLEKGAVITSYYEGKTRLYHFNPAYPVLQELEALLKKTYTLLPPLEKKKYYVIQDNPNSKERYETLFAFLDKLQKIRRMTFSAKTQSAETGWSGKGKGEVLLEKTDGSTFLFHEKGTWQNKEGEEFTFTNLFRWTIDRHAGVIALEHLRRGMDQPVFLFHLAPTGPFSLSSVNSHLCEGDTYFGQIHLDPYSLRLNWRVIGPKKNEDIRYVYH